jgi:hypothetical protein
MTSTPVTTLGRATPGDRFRVTFETADGEPLPSLPDPVDIELLHAKGDPKFLDMKFEFVESEQELVINRDLDDGRVQVMLLFPRADGLDDTDQTVYIDSADLLTAVADDAYR